MATQTLVFIALPNGFATDGRLRASIYFSPRLEAAAHLADFPDLLDWPDLIRRHGLRFHLACGPRAASVAADQSVLRPDVWREVFTPQSLVDAYPRPDFAERLLVSYPVRDAFAYLKWAYQVAATQSIPEERLLSLVLHQLVFRDGSSSTLDDTLARLRVELWQAQQPDVPVPQLLLSQPGLAPAPVDGVATSLAMPAGIRPMAERFALYHRLPPAPNRPSLPATAADFRDTLDFHKALAALYSYPALLRALGLVFDVELPVSLCPPSPGGPGNPYQTVAVSGVSPGWNWAIAPTLSFPATSYVRQRHSFAAAPAASPADAQARLYAGADIVGGFLALLPDFFQLVGFDLDGGLLKAMALADSFANIGDPSRVEDVLPSLRSSGISLIASGRAQQLLQAIRDNTAFQQALDANEASPRPLNARDLARGYRLDVWSSQTGRWHSLHRRDGTYRFGSDGGVALTTSDEEGFTQLAVTQAADDPTRPPDPIATAAGIPQPDTDLYVHERVARWNGWSLSAPRPGTPLNRSPDPTQATDPDPTAGVPLTPFKMTTSFTVRRGSLPRLRFGAHYRVRARAVDVAGNSPGLGSAVPAIFTLPSSGQTLPYLRFEPVPHPVLVLRSLPGPGGSLAQMVIRSRNSDPGLDVVFTAETDERHVAPPKAGVLLVEHHGMLDAAGHLSGAAATYAEIVARDSGEFPKQGDTPIEPAPQIAVPYFPDPIARGAALAGLPGTEDDTDGVIQSGALVYQPLPDVEPRPRSVTHIDFGPVWPGRRSFRLVLAEGRSAPTWNDAARTLTLWLPKGQTVSVPLSCYAAPEDLELMGVWNWMREFFDAAEAAALQQGGDAGNAVVAVTNTGALATRRVLDGSNEVITPAAALTLVHAVQQPLGNPAWVLLPIAHNPAAPIQVARLGNAFSPITAWRSPGSHHAVLLGGLRISGKSSAKIDIEARWREVIDDPADPAPTNRPASGHVEAIELRSLDAVMLAADGFNSRFVAVYMPSVDTLWFAAPFDTLLGVDPPAQVAAPVHQFGDTKHRRVHYQAIATSRFREYFTEPGLDFTRTSTTLFVDVPSSARPEAPDILYVVPTFGWERQESTNVKTEIRFGNGLRLYLNRPWYSSGESELLGVVLWAGNSAAPDDGQRDRFKAYFTQWGLDPIWQTGALAAVPAIGDFPEAAASGHSLTLQETALPVDVAGHRVAFDADRRLWYCDITLRNEAAYAPFIRLATARYQPHSIAGVELSPVVLADFAQLTPDRAAAITAYPTDARRARIVVGGLAPEAPTRSAIMVTIEQRIPEIGSNLGWRAALPGAVQVVEDAPAPTSPDAALWSGTVVFAATPAPGQFRVVIREYEILEADPPDGSVSGGPNYSERLVYASIIPYDFPA